jgi:hypothetical protein
LSLEIIREKIVDFLEFAQLRSDLTFRMTRIGCGLAGYKDNQIAPMFRGAPQNIIFPTEWLPYLDRRKAA